MVLLISYDRPDEDHDDFELVITKAAASALRVKECVWLVDTQEPPTWWRDELGATAPGTAVFVARLPRPWSRWKLGAEAAEWLRDRGRRW